MYGTWASPRRDVGVPWLSRVWRSNDYSLWLKFGQLICAPLSFGSPISITNSRKTSIRSRIVPPCFFTLIHTVTYFELTTRFAKSRIREDRGSCLELHGSEPCASLFPKSLSVCTSESKVVTIRFELLLFFKIVCLDK